MAYVKTTWQTGDVITAAKLNNAEGGIEALQPLFITVTTDADTGTRTMDKTFSEIVSALSAGRFCVVSFGGAHPGFMGPVIGVETSDYSVSVGTSGSTAGPNQTMKATVFIAENGDDDYPAYTPQ